MLAAEDRRGWSGSARSARVAELVEVGERLQAELLRTVGEWDAQADWAVDGMLSPRTWLKHHTPVTGVQTSRIVSTARLVHRSEVTGRALADGDISCAHVEVLAPMVRGREEEYAEHEITLVDAARALKADDAAIVPAAGARSSTTARTQRGCSSGAGWGWRRHSAGWA